MYYQAIIAFETGIVDSEGTPKVKKFKYIVESESVFEAPYEDILHPELTPKYYNL